MIHVKFAKSHGHSVKKKIKNKNQKEEEDRWCLEDLTIGWKHAGTINR